MLSAYLPGYPNAARVPHLGGASHPGVGEKRARTKCSLFVNPATTREQRVDFLDTNSATIFKGKSFDGGESRRLVGSMSNKKPYSRTLPSDLRREMNPFREIIWTEFSFHTWWHQFYRHWKPAQGILLFVEESADSQWGWGNNPSCRRLCIPLSLTGCSWSLGRSQAVARNVGRLAPRIHAPGR
ncbi:MAG: hypothetical protein A4E40_00235 [Methanoregulaceae archaeon PtaU1.Bin059]|nr:MAG: hypothetical protein A4E37_01223 [Methanoregulaceae archaeon PtaB.Bin056]OPY43062.1 MAG: hypothetical protein A4E40_00235 [Methanoregulaceae archaeon PtaU1.Bin059]